MQEDFARLWDNRFGLNQEQTENLVDQLNGILGNIGWFQNARLSVDKRQWLVDAFVPSVRAPGELERCISARKQPGAEQQVRALFREFVFAKLWQRRDQLDKGEMNLFYSLVVAVLKTSVDLNTSVGAQERADVINGFILDKILRPINEDRDKKGSWTSLRCSWHLLAWMKRYVIDIHRRQKTNSIDIASRSRLNSEADVAVHHLSVAASDATDPASHAIAEETLERHWSPDWLAGVKFRGEAEELHELRKMLEGYGLKPEAVLNASIDFWNKCEEWGRLLIANACSQNEDALYQLGKRYQIAAVHYKAAQLGIGVRKSYQTGSDTCHDYHENTTIGRWIKETFDVPVPLRSDLVEAVFKIICLVALNTNETRK